MVEAEAFAFFFISYKFTLFISPNKLRAFVLGEHDDKNLLSDTKEHEFFRSRYANFYVLS